VARQRMGEHMWMHRSGHKLPAPSQSCIHMQSILAACCCWGGVFSGHSQAGDSGRSLHVHLACHSFTQLLCCGVLYCEQTGRPTMKYQKTHAHPPDRRADPFPVAGSQLADLAPRPAARPAAKIPAPNAGLDGRDASSTTRAMRGDID
jgi:hypothetical protein